jgi:hypothetical protein
VGCGGADGTGWGNASPFRAAKRTRHRPGVNQCCKKRHLSMSALGEHTNA